MKKNFFCLGLCVFFLNSTTENSLIERSESISEKKIFDTKADFEKIKILKDRKYSYNELIECISALNHSFKHNRYLKPLKNQLKKCKKLLKSGLVCKKFDDETFRADFVFEESILYDRIKYMKENFEIIGVFISAFNDIVQEIPTPLLFNGSQEEFYTQREKLYKELRKELEQDTSAQTSASLTTTTEN